MQRPDVPEADLLLGMKKVVPPHGYVVLVDYMGNDAAIVQAARVSYGMGTKSVRDDRGLIRYLMRHRHTTPFEMVELKFLVRLPIYVARQWIRHRTACLAEGTRVSFDEPGGPRRGHRKHRGRTVEELWARFQPTHNASPPPGRNAFFRRDQAKGFLLRQLNEETRTFQHTHLTNVTKSGVKPVFRMTLKDGKSIDCTYDHRFLFEEGWSTLSDRTGLRAVNGRAVWDNGTYRLNVNGTPILRPALYQDRAWLFREYLELHRSVNDLAEACGVDRATILAWIRRFDLPSPPKRRACLLMAISSVRPTRPAREAAREGYEGHRHRTVHLPSLARSEVGGGGPVLRPDRPRMWG